MDAATFTDPRHNGRALQRVRYDTRRRSLTVIQTVRITPHLTSITLSGDLSGFQSPGFDDHIKLFFADPVTGILSLPDGNTDAPKPIMRDYTPRRFDIASGTLDIEFAIHQAGPATQWAMTAEPGDTIHIGGPRGSTLIPLAFDAYLLVGDDTALPAIARRLEEIPAGAKVVVVAEVDSADDRLDFVTQADASIHWVYRQTDSLNAALTRLHLPQGDMHAWVACEATAARLIRAQLIDDHGVDPHYVKASGYWRRDAVGSLERIDA